MNYGLYKIRKTFQGTQLFVFAMSDGSLVYSCESLFPATPLKNATGIGAFFESIWQDFKNQTTINSQCYYAVEVDIPEFHGWLDVEAEIQTDNGKEVLCLIALDRTFHYLQIRQRQQERNDTILIKDSLTTEIELEKMRRTILEERKHSLEEMLKFRQNLFAQLTHDFRTPLYGIIGLAEQLMEELQNTPQNQIIQSIYYTTFTLSEQINNFLEYSILEQGEIQFRPKVVSLRNWICQLIAPLKLLAEKKGIQFILEIEEQIPD
ncbi:MAG: HAMP domain-containing histidine kinase, partial [Bacteroidia bacterium]|nr:HAMP domain-containing histidine kinase [Bacteroidia bacterium]